MAAIPGEMSVPDRFEQFLCEHCGYGLFKAKVWKRRLLNRELPFLPRVCALVCARCGEEHT